MTTRTILSAALWIGLAASCGRGGSPKYPLASSPSAPGAQGNVNVEPGPNGNTRVAISVRHLAPPANISASATTYVAWIVPRAASTSRNADNQPTDMAPMNVGAINVDKNLNGTLETVTPFQQFDVMITPEPSPIAMRPTTRPVLSATVQEL